MGLVSQATVAYDHRFRRLEYQGRAGRVKTVVGVDEELRIKSRLGTVVGVLGITTENNTPAPIPTTERTRPFRRSLSSPRICL